VKKEAAVKAVEAYKGLRDSNDYGQSDNEEQFKRR